MKTLTLCTAVSTIAFSIAGYASGEMSTHIQNNSAYEMKMSDPWHVVYGGGTEFNPNPISVGQNPKVVKLEGDAFKGYTKYAGSYDVFNSDGSYKGNCSFSISGYPHAFISSKAEYGCSNGIPVDMKKMTGESGYDGYYQFYVNK